MTTYAGRLGAFLSAAVLLTSAGVAMGDVKPPSLRSGPLCVAVDRASGDISRLTETAGGHSYRWLAAPASVRLLNEVTGRSGRAGRARVRAHSGSLTVTRTIRTLGIDMEERWTPIPGGFTWDLTFRGASARAGHEVSIELPALTPRRSLFTPTERGVVRLAVYPTLAATPYGHFGWSDAPARFNVLPLVSVMEPAADRALTLALPPDVGIPDLRVDWSGARVLRLRMAHRAMGGRQASRLRLLFLTHAADYRSALRAYSDAFPRWFRPVLPASRYAGPFYYHHIQEHPDYAEMGRQDVRFVWSSFWFTHLGEYMPDGPEWYPYTYAKWWKLGATMNDDKIRSFVRGMHEHGIGTFAYFNVTEYGGYGGKEGSAEIAARRLREQFADALMKDVRGKDIPTWEGAMAMNPDSRYALFPFLKEQVRRHIARLPELDGFCIDRLDWANLLDYGHDDGLTMVGDTHAADMAGPVRAAVGEVCRQAHAAGLRVYVNQFWRIEPLKDVDGYCHEADYARGLGYLAPYRPVSAWHQQRPYSGDLLAFEAQLKTRLQFAVFPQMIAHTFPISQQPPAPRAADMLEIYAPLFRTLQGKRQVLLPHCLAASGPNDANLFVNGEGRYVAVVTSRVRFISRGIAVPAPVRLVVNVPDGAGLSWAHVVSADGSPTRVAVRHRGSRAEVVLVGFTTAAAVVLGRDKEPTIDRWGEQTASSAASRLGSPPPPKAAPIAAAGPPAGFAGRTLFVRGRSVGTSLGRCEAWLDGHRLGELRGGLNRFSLSSSAPLLTRRPPVLRILTGDEGAWYAVERAELSASMSDGAERCIARWSCDAGKIGDGGPADTRLELAWCAPESDVRSHAAPLGKNIAIGSDRRGKIGAVAAWMPGTSPAVQNGFKLETTEGAAFTWAEHTDDARALTTLGGTRTAACWFDDRAVGFALTPPNSRPYRLTLYVLDFDRNGRALDIDLADDYGTLSTATVTRAEAAGGAYLSWRVSGPVAIRACKAAGANAVVSAVFIDSP